MISVSNTQAKKTTADQEPDQAAMAQQAQVDEATGTPRSFEFDGHTYELLDGQPSPKAITYLARWQVDDENLAMVLAVVEMIGQSQWQQWCERHPSTRINDFWMKLNEVAGGN